MLFILIHLPGTHGISPQLTHSNLPIDQAVLIEYIALLGKGIEHLGRPLAELDGARGIDAIAHRDDCRQGIKIIPIGFAIIRNLFHFGTNITDDTSK